MDTQVVSISLLGIKISVSDFAILGSMSLGLLTYYMFLCSRRENHEIGYLFQDLSEVVDADKQELSNELKAQAYHAFSMVASFMVFNPSGDHSAGGKTDGSISSLKRPSTAQYIRRIRFASGLLYFLPLIVILCTMCCDSGWLHISNGHLFFVSPFRLHPDGVKPGPLEDRYFYFTEGFAAIMALAVAGLSVKVRQYEKASRDVLEEFFRSVLIEKCGAEKRWKLKGEVHNERAVESSENASSAIQ